MNGDKGDISAAVYSAAEARDKNRDEYNETADDYNIWAENSILMQQQSYYAGFNEMLQDGIEGKTFLEIGCGQCPCGQKLAAKGAKKIYGLDISEGMIEIAKKELTQKGLIDKFELICADIFDESFQLEEKVDVVVCQYTISTFINNFEMLTNILKRCKAQAKPDGYVIVADFSYVDQPCDNWFYGMHTGRKEPGVDPKPFEPFDFFIDRQPDSPYECFNIPADVMFKAAREAGFNKIDYTLAYPNPEFKDNPVIRKYIDECKAPDYVMKMRCQNI